MTFDYRFLFPDSILIATTAMASVIGGVVFFSPLFMIVLKLEPSVAVGTALTTEFLGFSSGVFAYWRRRLIDFKLARGLLMFSVPAAVVGGLSADAFPAAVLKAIFAVAIIFIGTQLYSSCQREEKENLNKKIERETRESHESLLTNSVGNEYRYTVCNKDQGRMFAGHIHPTVTELIPTMLGDLSPLQ